MMHTPTKKKKIQSTIDKDANMLYLGAFYFN